MNLFDLVATLRLDTSQYEQGLYNAGEKGKSFGGKLGKVMAGGTAVIAGLTTAVAGASIAFTNSAKDVANYGDNIDKMSQKLGLSAEAYQKWDYVIQLSGANIDSMATGLKTLTNKLEDAKNGGAKSIETFSKLGISMEELEGASREEVFEKTIKAFQGMEDSAERAALANKLFGRSGQELAPLFNQSAESTEQLLEQAEKYGMVMSEKAVKASAEFNDSLTTLQNTSTGLKNRLMGEFLPSLTKVTDGLALIFTGDVSGADSVVEGIKDLISGINQQIPKIFELGGEIVSGLADAILEGAPMLFEQGTAIITTLVGKLIEQLPNIISVGTDIITSVIDGITNSLPDFIEKVPMILVSLVTALAQNLPKVIASGGKLLLALIEGVIKAIPILIKQAPVIISQFVQGLLSMVGEVFNAGDSIIASLSDGISNAWDWFKGVITGFFEQIPTIITNAISGLYDIGSNIVSGIWEGISGGLRWIKDMISGWVGNVMDFIKSLFGISSPSKWARDVIGGNIVKGLVQGIENGEDLVQSTFDSLVPEYNADGYTVSVDKPSAVGGVSIVNYITVDGAENPEEFTDRFVRRLRLDMRTI